MKTRVYARAFAFLLVLAASCQSDMPSIKRSQLTVLVSLLLVGFVATMGSERLSSQ